MIKAVLFDLDDTLLATPFNDPDWSYRTWDVFFNQRTGLPTAAAGVNAAIGAIVANLNPVERNFDVFMKAIIEQWGLPPETISAVFDDFYREVYEQTSRYATRLPAAPALLDRLKAAGYQVVIATNPFYRPEALARRLGWAGLPTDFDAYALVTHIENMHYAKPNPHYYEEILGRLGIANEEALMVGDDWVNDIVPAEKAGLNTYWIREPGASRGPGEANPDGEGTLDDFTRQVCDHGWLDTLTPRPATPEMIVPRLLGNVAALFGILAEYAPDYWQQHPDPDEWSPLEVVCHLRDSESATQRPRLERIAAEDNPFLSAPLEPPGPGQMACEVEYYCDPAEEFAAERMKTVAFLEGLPPEAWSRPARHSIFGPTTLLEMAAFTATHDRLHIQQICQTIGQCQ